MSIPTLRLKPDFAATATRFEAWWQGELADRLPITLPGEPLASCDDAPPPRAFASLREQWLDVPSNVERLTHALVQRTWPGDALPVLMPNIGPELTGTLYGCELEFGETTSWSLPVVHELDDWHAILDREPDFTNVYWRTIEAMTQLAIDRNDGRYLVGLPDLHGNFDILASLREPESLCVDLMDDPALIARIAMHLADGYNQAFERMYRMICATGSGGAGSTTWTRMYHDGPAYLPSCDFWCMISHEQARDLALPAILEECKRLERTLFHLDGPQALRHLDLLLERPEIHAIQWVYGAGNGPAMKWIDVYKRVLAAGRSVQVNCEDEADAAAVLRELGPQGVWLCIDDIKGAAPDAVVERLGR